MEEGETEKEAGSCHPSTPCLQRLSFSAALNSAFCLQVMFQVMVLWLELLRSSELEGGWREGESKVLGSHLPPASG